MIKLNLAYFTIISLLLTSSRADSQKSPINRYELVNRHNVVLQKLDPLSPLSVGNGDFAFTVDVTGLQTFGDFYYKNGIPLETLSSWGWHCFPNTKNYRLEDASKEYNVHGRQVAYASLEKSPAGQYFRKNPHRIPLGQLGLVLLRADGSPVEPNEVKNIRQKLDLWTGLIRSSYQVEGEAVLVETICHPEIDLVAVQIQSPLLKKGRLKPSIRFCYAYDARIKNKPPFDWEHQDLHKTKITSQTQNSIGLQRTLDDSVYYVNIAWAGDNQMKQKGPHEFILEPGDSEDLRFVCVFSNEPVVSELPSFASTKTVSAKSWEQYWTSGGAVDLSGSTDPRANELERRIVLSQYLVKIQYSGTFPPQESGLTHISWYGKHNTEMYWWHTAHFAQWGRPELLEKSLPWYRSILPKAKALAKQQGFEGASWPKMTGPDGQPSPGGINPFIIWNQPNLIYLAELCYRAHPDRKTLEKYSDLVFESAKFLASYAYFDEKIGRYNLGPPIRSVSEKSGENTTKNPTFELAYWHFGLSVAQKWRERLGLQRDPKWDDILQKLSPLSVQDGLYLDIETEPDIFNRNKSVSTSMLMALGFLPQGPMVDRQIMHRTLKKIIELNGMNSFVSWSSGAVAMTAARLGEQNIAIDILCNDEPQSRYLPNGLVPRPKEPLSCPAYFPVNCSLLSAVALMAAGWDGAPDVNAPGFPQDGRWTVRWENLQQLP